MRFFKNKELLVGSFLLLLPFQIQGQADSSSVEWIRVYFNMPARHSVSLPGNESRDRIDLLGTFVSLIDSATTSIDLNIYDLEHPRAGEALARAKRRGVRVRLITDNYNRADSRKADSRKADSSMWAMLRHADIISMDDDGDVYHADGTIEDHSLTNSGADMHNKFAVIDALSSNPEDDYVWTGSTNLTYTGIYNTNNTIVIKDNEVAARYVEEFEQMWGGDEELPNPADARFHKDKGHAGENVFHVGDVKLELYFAPINRTDTKPSISRRLVEVIEKEVQHDISFQAFAITPGIPLSQIIWKMSATGNVELNGVIDRSFYYRYKKNGDIWASPEAQRANRMILPSSELRKLHHKIMILDGAHPYPADNGVTITGSYNFSKNAEYNNDENLLIIYSDSIANQYYQDFMGVVSRAKKESYPPAPPVNTTQWYKEEKIIDGNEFEVEVVPGFEYGVQFLGVDVPSVYAGRDSSDFFAPEAAQYLRNFLNGAEVRLEGPYGSEPDVRYGAFQAYVTMKKNGTQTSLNRILLKEGIGRYVPYYNQHPDSVIAYKNYQKDAKKQRKGIWKHPDKIETKISRTPEEKSLSLANAFPININTADESTLRLLPGIGPVYAQRIIALRKRQGRFKNVDELLKIKGIGPKTLAKLRANIIVD